MQESNIVEYNLPYNVERNDQRNSTLLLTPEHNRKLRGVLGFVSGNICSEGLDHLRYSDLIAVKTTEFFRKTSAQTFVTRGLTNSFCFRWDKYVKKCNQQFRQLRMLKSNRSVVEESSHFGSYNFLSQFFFAGT